MTKEWFDFSFLVIFFVFILFPGIAIGSSAAYLIKRDVLGFFSRTLLAAVCYFAIARPICAMVVRLTYSSKANQPSELTQVLAQSTISSQIIEVSSAILAVVLAAVLFFIISKFRNSPALRRDQFPNKIYALTAVSLINGALAAALSSYIAYNAPSLWTTSDIISFVSTPTVTGFLALWFYGVPVFIFLKTINRTGTIAFVLTGATLALTFDLSSPAKIFKVNADSVIFIAFVTYSILKGALLALLARYILTFGMSNQQASSLSQQK